MHDCMPYGPIQGQDQGYGACEVLKIALFKVYLLCHLQWDLADDHRFLNYGTVSKFVRAELLIVVLLFLSQGLELGGSLWLVCPVFLISVKFGM